MTTTASRGRRRSVARVRAAAALALTAALAALSGGCGAEKSATRTTPPGVLPQGADAVRLDPGNFTTNIDNPYMPLAPGSVWVYAETEPDGPPERDVITVSNRTKVVAGVTARVVHDRATRGSQVIEDTFDWFAQDRVGNVWYLGEATQGYKNGKPSSTSGSWEAGVHGAQPGVAMPASPAPGLEYRQEYRKGKAEDRARVLSVDDQVQSPVGHYDNAVLTKEFSPLEPNDLEYKLYAKGVGLVMAIGASGDLARETLVSFRKGGG
jgi:hypothetical protein